MNTKNKLVIAALLCTPVAANAADGISYTYLEADWIVQNIDAYESDGVFDNFREDIDDGDGYSVRGSFAFTPNFYGFASYSSTESDFNYVNNADVYVDSSTDTKTLKVGLGYAYPLSDRVDFTASGSYIDMDYGDFALGANDSDIDEFDDIDNAVEDLGDDSTDGFSVDAGVRAQVVEWMELGGGLRYTDIDPEDNVSAYGNILFEINPMFGINLGGDFGDNLSEYYVGVRFSL